MCITLIDYMKLVQKVLTLDLLSSTNDANLRLHNTACPQSVFLGQLHIFAIGCTVLGSTAGNNFLECCSEQLSLHLYLMRTTEMPSLQLRLRDPEEVKIWQQEIWHCHLCSTALMPTS
jgi:hypothetical protein